MIRKLSVIGGAGFIGSHLCKQLENLNIDFEIVDIKKVTIIHKKLLSPILEI